VVEEGRAETAECWIDVSGFFHKSFQLNGNTRVDVITILFDPLLQKGNYSQLDSFDPLSFVSDTIVLLGSVVKGLLRDIKPVQVINTFGDAYTQGHTFAVASPRASLG